MHIGSIVYLQKFMFFLVFSLSMTKLWFMVCTSLFASLTIGMLEYWNTGILGSGKMESWVIVKFLLTEIK